VANGFIKLNRKLIDSVSFKNSELLHVWIFLLLDANHGESKVPVGNQVITVKPGQMITSRKRISEQTGIQESKVERLLITLKTEQQIEQQSFTKYRIISIVNWNTYQNSEQQSEQQMNNKRTASEHIKECKEDKEVKPLPQKARKAPSGDHQLFISYWLYAYKKIIKEDGYVSGSDQKAIKAMLKTLKVGRIILCAAYFLLDEDEWLEGKKTISMLQTKIGGMPHHQKMDMDKMRELQIIPQVGIGISDWKFWEV
jgi:hypothetical protein